GVGIGGGDNRGTGKRKQFVFRTNENVDALTSTGKFQEPDQIVLALDIVEQGSHPLQIALRLDVLQQVGGAAYGRDLVAGSIGPILGTRRERGQTLRDDARGQ